MKSLTYQYNGKVDEVSSHREKLRKTLSKACENIDIPYVLAVKGGYGTGKTSFLKHLQADLEENNMTTIWFDAWQSDHIQDPFAALMASFDNQILEKHFKTSETRRNILNTAKKYGLGFGKFALKAGGKILAGSQATEELVQLLQEDKADEDTLVSTVLDEGVVSLTQHFAEKFFNYKEFQRGFDEFKTQLTSIAEAMKDKSKQQKIVIFVDELDRCRPDYAIEVLEVIKHFFDAERVVFILSICEEAMKGAVSSVYHADVDYISYMNKFINSSFSLPKIPTESYWKYMQKQESQFQQLPEMIHQYLPVLMEGYNVSLRDQDRIFSALCFINQFLQGEDLGSTHKELRILDLLYVMKLYVKDFPKVYEQVAAMQLLRICARRTAAKRPEVCSVLGYLFHYSSLSEGEIKQEARMHIENYFKTYNPSVPYGTSLSEIKEHLTRVISERLRYDMFNQENIWLEKLESLYLG